MASEVEELRFHTVETEILHFLKSKPINLKDRRLLIGGRFYQRSRDFAGPTIPKSADQLFADVADPAKVRRTLIFIFDIASRPVSFALV